ncbi:hypothetical protein [Ornithinimicrobium avium]|uniref:hypothetical protein n=1 Tax=Ornithinimicrobium avium TaxID=2283195 RepID=UPI001D18FCD5|nr:hypothetical protein [Ornithinimicrobium avium]
MSSTTVDPAHWSALSVVLTDTELDVLERAIEREEGTAAEDPDELDGPALEEAVRSLTLRGVLGPDGCLGDDLLGVWLDAVLSTRLAAGLVLRVHRTVAGPVGDGLGADLTDDPHARHGERLVHLAAGAACVEDAMPGGVQLALAEPDQVVSAVVAVCVPENAAAGTGPSFTHAPAGLTRPTVDLADALGRPTSLVRLEAGVPEHAAAATGGDRPPLPPPSCHLVALGPRGCWAADLPPDGTRAEVEFRPVGPGWVEDWVRARAAPFAGQGTMAG